MPMLLADLGGVIMHVQSIDKDKKTYLDLLLIADEEEHMIDRYLERGEMFALYDDDLRALSVVTDEGDGFFEIKNIVMVPAYQRRGYGRKMIEWICRQYRGRGHTLLVGTGESEKTVSFYRTCGFVYSHRVCGFFTQNYSRPIVEEGKQLVDMIYLKKELK